MKSSLASHAQNYMNASLQTAIITFMGREKYVRLTYNGDTQYPSGYAR
jgi:hypothetical protein